MWITAIQSVYIIEPTRQRLCIYICIYIYVQALCPFRAVLGHTHAKSASQPINQARVIRCNAGEISRARAKDSRFPPVCVCVSPEGYRPTDLRARLVLLHVCKVSGKSFS